MKTAASVDAYIVMFPAGTQKILRELRAIIKKEAPEALEKISYGMPGYMYHGRFLYFAGHKNHVGLYALPSAIKHFKKELAGFTTSIGTIQFALDTPLPKGLVKKIVRYRVAENERKLSAQKKPAVSEFPKMPAPAMRALLGANVKTLKDLSKKTEKEIVSLHGMGPSTMPKLRAALKIRGLTFKKSSKGS